MTSTLTTTIRFSALAGLAILLAGCSMGSMSGGGTTTNADLQNATATPQAVAQAQTNALPVIATECPPIKVRLGGEAMYYYGNGRVGDPKALQYQGVIDETSRNCVVSNGQITVNMGVTGRVLLGPAGSQTMLPARDFAAVSIAAWMAEVWSALPSPTAFTVTAAGSSGAVRKTDWPAWADTDQTPNVRTVREATSNPFLRAIM